MHIGNRLHENYFKRDDCRGVLTLQIDGEVMKFGDDGGVEEFWQSGGYIDEDYNAIYGEWLINVEKLPEKIKKYASEIDMVFNAKVPMGCCGGCI